jgi:hypothetical protein
MTPGQHDAAMIHLRWGQRWMILDGKSDTLDQRPSAGRTPIRHGFLSEHRPALAANPFHAFKIIESDWRLWFPPPANPKAQRYNRPIASRVGGEKKFFPAKKAFPGIFQVIFGGQISPCGKIWG